MKWSLSVVAAALVAAMPLAAQAQFDEKDLEGRDVTFRGCVQQGAEKGHYVLTRFNQMPAAGEVAFPRMLPDGRRVFFWFEDLPKLDRYFNQMVEVKGELLGTRDGEVETKFEDGQVIVELEGPGRDVDLTADKAREVVGTSGTGSNKTLLIRVDVDAVDAVAATCL